MGGSARPKIDHTYPPKHQVPPGDDMMRPHKETAGHPTEKNTEVTITFLRTFLFVSTAEVLWLNFSVSRIQPWWGTETLMH